MPVRLYARGSDGKVMICAGGITSATLTDYLNKPKKNISNIFFHSDLSYMSLESTVTASLTFPYRAANTQTTSGKKDDVTYDVPTSGTDLYEISTHNLGYIPFATSARGADQVTPTSPFQNVGASFRLLNISMTTQRIYVQETWVTYKSALPAITESFKVWIFRNPS
jgi:hypothetical protein